MAKFEEDALQMKVMQYIRLQYPNLLAFHPANERKCSPAAGARLKKKGVMAGVADILCFWPGGHGAIELKAGKNKTQPTQDYFAGRWQWAGGNYAVCRSLDEVIETLEKWFKNG